MAASTKGAEKDRINMYKKGIDKEEGLIRREDNQITIRNEKRQEKLAKKRGIAEGNKMEIVSDYGQPSPKRLKTRRTSDKIRTCIQRQIAQMKIRNTPSFSLPSGPISFDFGSKGGKRKSRKRKSRKRKLRKRKTRKRKPRKRNKRVKRRKKTRKRRR